ncbi:MAG: nitrilase-related carbon-nitrogen hydrolase [Syntrophobacteraceae bacterium]|jgi:hypothetical protein
MEHDIEYIGKEMDKVVEQIVNNNLHAALVGCWKLLDPSDNLPFFQEQEYAALNENEDSPYQKQKKRVDEALWADEPLLIRNLPREYPLALLEVLDDYLYKYFDCPAGLTPLPYVLLDGETYVIRRRVLQRSMDTAHASKTGHLQRWLRHHWIVPARISSIEIRIRSTHGRTYNAIRLLENGEFKVYVGSFPDGVGPLWLNDDPAKWSAREITEPETRWSSVSEALEEALAAGAAVVVLPELTICPILRRRVRDWLDDHPDHPFILVLPGSFHEEKDGKVFNIAELVNYSGYPLLHHRKLTRFGTKEKLEGIVTGSHIELLDTSIGLIGIPICLDFCEEGNVFNSLWETIGAECLLVPAFGWDTSIHAHLSRAGELFRKHGTVSIIANQHPEGKDQDHGFVYEKALRHDEPPAYATRGCRTFTVKINPSGSDK